jgi:uncharacterized membrane protein
MIKRISNFEIFLQRKEMNSSVPESLRLEVEQWALMNESSLLDDIKNKLSKSIFGDFSKIGVIDTIRKGNFDLKKEMIQKKYDTDEELEDLYLKRSEVKKSGNQSALRSVDSQIEKKKQEFLVFKKVAQGKIEKGLNLLAKAIDKNKRRKEYYEAGLKEDELKLSEFEYELAKKLSADSSELTKLKNKIDKARKEAGSLIQSLVKKTTSTKTKTP